MKEYSWGLIHQSPELYLDELQEQLFIQGGNEWLLHCSTIWRVLKEDFNWSLKVANARAAQRNEDDRNRYRRRMRQVHDPAMFIFVDESHRGRNESRRRRAWGPRGKDNSLDELFEDDHRFTLIAAADINGMVLPSCELVEMKRSSTDQDPTRGTVDADRFVLWVQQRLVPVLGSALHGDPRSVVVMDNASIHKDPRVRKLIEDAGAQLIYTAPYSPDLMPIEFPFHQYKAYLRRHIRRGCACPSLSEIHVAARLTATSICAAITARWAVFLMYPK
jgi:hypothetical protein